MITEQDEDRRSPAAPAPHSEWRLARSAEHLLSSYDAAAYAVRDAVAGGSAAPARSGRHAVANEPAVPMRSGTDAADEPTAPRRSGGDTVSRSPADVAETPRVTTGPLFITAGIVVMAVTGALSAAALSARLAGPGWVGALVTAGTGALAGMSAVVACTRGRVRSSPVPRDRLPVPVSAAASSGIDERGSGADRRGGRSAYPVRAALVLTGASACVTIWVLLLTRLVSARELAAAGVALPEIVAFVALPLSAGAGTARRRRPVRRLGRVLADRRTTRRARRAHARARRILLAHERAWHRVVLSAQTLADVVPEPDRDAVHAALTAMTTSEGETRPLPSGAGGALHTAVRLLRATDPSGLKRRLAGESGSGSPRSGAEGGES